MAKLIQRANMKLGENTMMFNIPACPEVCGRVCEGCYSYKAYRIYPNVLPAQERRLRASKQPDFTTLINGELSRLRKNPKYFRIHGSAGEFYSQRYINDWQAIVKKNPSVIFYAYTKRVQEFNFKQLASLPNMVLINSFHFGKTNFGPKSDTPKGAFVCPEVRGKVTCGIDCTWCQQKNGAAKHGVFFIQH